MPSSTPPTAESNKSRQSSGGRSFFGRKLHKDRPETKNWEDGGFTQDLSSGSNSVAGSKSSRHSHRPSVQYVDMDKGEETAAGLSMTAGVITSIPYDSTSSNNKTPIPVDYLPRQDQVPTRKEPLPHHLNKGGGDFHQYPAWDPKNPNANGSSHPTGPRPPPNISSSALVARDRHQTLTRPGTSSSAANVSHGTNNSYSTVDSSTNPRNSFDQVSIYSTQSNQTRGSSIFSSDNSSRTAIQSPVQESHLRPKTSHMSTTRQSYTGWNQHSNPSNPQQSNFSTTTGFNPEGFSLPRPSDDNVIEAQFVALMHKRGWQHLPDQARRQMLAYPAAKKWTLVHQDKLTEWQGEQKRKQHVRQTLAAGDGLDMLGRANEEGSPEWYVKRVMDDTINAKQLQSLSVSLRTQPISWVKCFVEAQGQVALTNVLGKINRRQAQGPAPTSGTTSDKDLDREYDIVKCLKALMNNKYGADDALSHQQVVVALATSLISPRLTTRKLVSEVLTFLCHWAEGEGHLKVLQAMDHVKHQQGENGRFDAWMRIVEVTIDGRGKMGSLVGASEEVRSGGIGMENLLMEYAVASLFLLNMMIDAPERDLQLRCHIRAQFTSCGIKRILNKMEGFQYEVIDKQVEHYRENEAIDYEDLLQKENNSMKHSIEGEVKDMHDPTQIVDAIMMKVQGSRSQDYFLSAMQHMLLIRDNDGEDRLRMFQLVDAMLSYVAMDRRLPDMDLKQSLNFSVQSLLDRLHTDSEARQAHEEATESRQIAESAMAERDEMKSQIELGANGLVAKLQKQVEEQAAIIELQGRQNEALKAELSELQRLRAQDLQRSELETRELYLMLRDAQDVAASNANKGGKDPSSTSDPKQMQGILDRERLMDRLEIQLERAKTQCKLEGKVWQQSGPSDRLRELREKMDGEMGQQNVDPSDLPSRNLHHSMLGSTSRSKILKGSRRAVQEALAGRKALPDIPANGEDETVRPQLVDVKRPRMDPRQATGLLREIAAKIPKYDAGSEDEGDGVTTGPSHPSLESDSPKTPSDEGMPKFEFSGPPPPPPPPLPSAHASVSSMPGFENGPPPPPAPPVPSPTNSLSPSMPGFETGAPPPPPPPIPSTPNTPLTPTHPGLMGPPPAPGAPPLPGPKKGGYLSHTQYGPTPTIGLPFTRPKKKLKALHWEKVDTPQVTVWAAHAPSHEAKEEKYLELARKGVLDEVEKLFLAKDIKVLGAGGKTKSDKKQIISSDMTRNFHVSLAKFSSFSADEVVRMVIHCDTEVLDNNVVMDFLSREDMCVIPDNTAKLMAPYSKDWTGPDALKTAREQDPAELTREDQIYLQTAYELHHYWKSRMRALALTRSFEPEYDEISKQLKQVVSVSESLRDSVSLMNVLGLILDIGNYMNDSNKQANGFKLSSLARLGMVKDDKNESTFADLVERIVRNQYPEWEQFVDDIGGVVAAQKLNVEQLQLEAKRYIDNIKNVQASLDSGNLSDTKKFHPQDRVSLVVQRSMKDARRKAEQMQLYLEEMVRTYDDIMVFYGEDSSDENARRDFFAKLATFVVEWKKSKEKNIGMEETRRRNEASMARKRAANHAINPAAANAGQLSPLESPNSPSTAGAMDSLLEKLRAAAPQARDQRDRRRRARLKDRHQDRIASGQKIPDMNDVAGDSGAEGDSDKGTGALLSPDSAAGDTNSAGGRDAVKGAASEGEDIADRAASMLQGLRGGDTPGVGNGADGAGDPAAPDRDGSVRVRRRRESADVERRDRRRRRTQIGSGSNGGVAEKEGGDGTTTSNVGGLNENGIIHEEPAEEEEGQSDRIGRELGSSTNGTKKMPDTLVSPPSGEEGSKAKPVQIDD